MAESSGAFIFTKFNSELATKKQFGALIKDYEKCCSDPAAMKTLEKVSVTVSSNIHLNSFMYEPILDLTIEHLVALYVEVQDLLK